MISSADILKASILIVDDQDANVSLLEQMLRGAGYVAIASTTDPHQVCELYRQNRYNLILLDLQMPGMDGFQVMESLKEIETTGYLPVLVITAQPGHKLRALKAGAKDFVSKPFELPEVLIRVYNMLEVRLVHLALRQSEERFRFVARAVSDVVWDWDLAANTLWWNDSFLTTFGFGASEIEPSVESWTSRIHPDERGRVIDSIHHAINAGADSWSAEYRFQRKDGSHAFVQDRGYIVRDAAGKGVRMVGGMRDLTEQKKMEAQYLRAQRMDTLAGSIADDLNNVLTPIMMSIELLKLGSGNDPRRSKILDTIHGSCRRGADLVRQVVSFARGLDGRPIAIRLRHLIDDFAGVISGTFPRNIQIFTEVPSDLWPIMGDPIQLHQVLLNLAGNARDAMPHGGRLTLTAANLTIDPQFAGTSGEAKAGPHVLLQLTDTGIGIPPEVRKRIFEPFFTTKELGKDTGVGLATVDAVVKSHGGFLNVESAVDRGTTFKIYLPADPTLRGGQAVPALVELPRGRDELVLVADDEFSIRDITQQTLEAFGYRVITASDGAEAVALYAKQAQQISVVLIDMMMPIMKGAATIQVLLRINPSVRVIATSGLEVTENIAEATRAGGYDFLPKPCTAQTLVRLVREVLDRPAKVETILPLSAATRGQEPSERDHPRGHIVPRVV